MTEAQLKRKYWPAWGRVVKAHDWRMDRRRLAGEERPAWGGAETTALYRSVWEAARWRAGEALRGVTPDDLRHGAHRTALGRDRSSKEMNSADLDRVLALFGLLADPDDLGSMMAWLHPENAARKRMLWYIENRTVEGYARHVCRSKFGTDDWQRLSVGQLRQLVMTLRNRAAAQAARPERAAAAGPPPRQALEPAAVAAHGESNCPF